MASHNIVGEIGYYPIPLKGKVVLENYEVSSTFLFLFPTYKVLDDQYTDIILNILNWDPIWLSVTALSNSRLSNSVSYLVQDETRTYHLPFNVAARMYSTQGGFLGKDYVYTSVTSGPLVGFMGTSPERYIGEETFAVDHVSSTGNQPVHDQSHRRVYTVGQVPTDSPDAKGHGIRGEGLQTPLRGLLTTLLRYSNEYHRRLVPFVAREFSNASLLKLFTRLIPPDSVSTSKIDIGILASYLVAHTAPPVNLVESGCGSPIVNFLYSSITLEFKKPFIFLVFGLLIVLDNEIDVGMNHIIDKLGLVVEAHLRTIHKNVSMSIKTLNQNQSLEMSATYDPPMGV